MITIDTNLSLICSMINVSYKKITDVYSGMSLEEILEAEAAQGNAAAANFDKEVLHNPAKLAEVFGLDNVENKFAILSNMSEHDLENLLPLLQQEDLAVGLKFFDKEKLLKLIGKLPPEQLVNYMLEMFPPQKLIQLMPIEFVDKFLQSDDLDKGLVMKHLKSLPPEVLAQMLETVTGEAAESMDQGELVNQIGSLPPQKYKDALVGIPEDKKREFVLAMVKEEPKLLESFDPEGFVKIASKKDKPDLVKAAEVIDPEELVKMLKELPKELLSVVMTQIDSKTFAELLIDDYNDILQQIMVA